MDWQAPRTILILILLAHVPTLAVSIFHYYSPFVRRVAVVGIIGSLVSLGVTLALASPLSGVITWSAPETLQPLSLRPNWIYWSALNGFMAVYLVTFVRNRTPAPYPVKRVCFLTGLVISLILISGAANIFSLFLGSVLLSVCYSFFLGNIADFEEYQAIGVVTWRNGCADIFGLFALSGNISWGLGAYVFLKSLALSPLGIWKRPGPTVWVTYLLMTGAMAFPVLALRIPLWVFLLGIGAGIGIGITGFRELAWTNKVGLAIGQGLGRVEKGIQFVFSLPMRVLKAGWVLATFLQDATVKTSLLVSLVLVTLILMALG